MRDDDGGDVGWSCLDDIEGEYVPRCAEELFGEFCVLSPGVQIVIEGRPVSNAGH